MSKRATRRVAIVAILLALAGCGRPSQPGARPGGTAGVSGPAGMAVAIDSSGTPYGPLWLDDGLYFGVEPKNDNDRHELWRWRNGKAERVALRLPADCYGSLLQPVRRPGGSLAVSAGCFESGVLRYRVLAVDRSNGTTSPLFKPDRAPGYVSWLGQTGFASVVTGDCAAVTRVSGNTLEPIETGPTFDGLAWPSSRWAADGGTTCPGGGRVVFPATLDRTDSVVALATGDGGDTAAWTLFLAPAGLTGAATAVAGGFVRQAGVAVTPDGSRFVVAATRDGRAGLWLVDTSGSVVRLVASGSYSGAAIAPDGQRLASVNHGSLRVFTL
jgi:hypothetical protein